MKRKGFTLVEVMIVICITVILAAIVVPSFFRAKKLSQMNKMGITDIELRETLIKSHLLDVFYKQYKEDGKISHEEMYIATGLKSPISEKLFPEDPKVEYSYHYEIICEDGTIYFSDNEPEIQNNNWVKFLDSKTREFRTIKNVQQVVRKREIKN